MKNYKTIVTKEQSSQIQELVFRLGGSLGNEVTEIDESMYPYLFIENKNYCNKKGLFVTYSFSEDYFRVKSNEFIEVDELITKLEKKVEKYTFKKFLKDNKAWKTYKWATDLSNMSVIDAYNFDTCICNLKPENWLKGTFNWTRDNPFLEKKGFKSGFDRYSFWSGINDKWVQVVKYNPNIKFKKGECNE